MKSLNTDIFPACQTTAGFPSESQSICGGLVGADWGVGTGVCVEVVINKKFVSGCGDAVLGEKRVCHENSFYIACTCF